MLEICKYNFLFEIGFGEPVEKVRRIGPGMTSFKTILRKVSPIIIYILSPFTSIFHSIGIRLLFVYLTTLAYTTKQIFYRVHIR